MSSIERLIETLRAEPWAGPGPIVRELRRGRGMRLKDLAAATGLSIGYLSRLERTEAGGDNPSMANLETLARALDVPLTALLPPGAGSSDAPAADTVGGIIGREVLLAVTYRQPVTLPMLERLCARVGDPPAIAAALEHLMERGIVRRMPPPAPDRPIYYVLEWERQV